jgi:UDP-N-acetylglucosamine 2-epimerase (non-hydrolysing)
LHLIDPLGYLDFLALTRSAKIDLTDSGGIQEETTYLGIPCLTIRPNTERPVTIEIGTNRLVASTRAAILDAVEDLDHQPESEIPVIPGWDGKASGRIVDVMLHQNNTLRN